MASTPRRAAFFSLSAQRKEPVVWSAPHHCERAALPLRRPRSTGCGTGGARTRCAQTACPFFPVPHPAARLSAKGLFVSPETHPTPNHPPCGASAPPATGNPGGALRAIVPTLQRGNAAQDAPASTCAADHHRTHQPLSRAWPAPPIESCQVTVVGGHDRDQKVPLFQGFGSKNHATAVRCFPHRPGVERSERQPCSLFSVAGPLVRQRKG